MGPVSLARATGLTGKHGWYSWSALVDMFGHAGTLSVLIAFPVAVLHFDSAQVGGILAIAVVIGVCASVPVGRQVDRFGPRHIAWWSSVSAAAATWGIACSPPDVMIFASLATVRVLSRTAKAAAGTTLVVSHFDADTRREVLGRSRVAEHLGLAAGLLLGGIALSTTSPVLMRVALVVDGMTFIASGTLIVLFGTRAVPRKYTDLVVRTPSFGSVGAPYVRAAVIVGLISINFPLGVAGIGLWILQGTDLPTFAITVALVANIIATVSAQAWATARVGDADAASRGVRIAAFGTAIGVAILPLGTLPNQVLQWAVLIAAALTVAVAETLLVTCSWELSVRLAQSNSPGLHQGWWKATTTVLGEGVGNAVVGLTIAHGSLALGALAATLALLGSASSRLLRL